MPAHSITYNTDYWMVSGDGTPDMETVAFNNESINHILDLLDDGQRKLVKYKLDRIIGGPDNVGLSDNLLSDIKNYLFQNAIRGMYSDIARDLKINTIIND
jgi:hypothetical protein